MNVINCQFCNRKCRQFYDGRKSHCPGRKYYRCDYHGAVVVKHVPYEEIGSMKIYKATILAVLYRDNTYEVSFFYDREFGEKFRIDKMNLPPKTVETIVTLDFHPDITPENIVAKLPTYLLFS